MDSHAGTFLTPAHLGHRGDTGGGQPPPPTVPYLRHDVAMAGSERMHWHIAQCKKGEKRKIWRLVAEEDRAATSRAFSAYGCPLEMVTSFKYLGNVLSQWRTMVGRR